MNDKLKSAVYGLAVGDALGVPVEFMKRGSFRVTGMTGYGSHNQPAGTWSDDTSMTLATCDSIRVLGRVDCDDIRNRFRQWLYNAEYTVDNVVFDVGNTTARALRCGKGEDSEYSNGNGSLMRILPLAFTNAEDELIGEVSAITHAHTLSKSICIKYVELARALLNGMPFKDVLTDLGKETAALAELTEFEIKSSGYVVDTFRAALWSLATTDNYKDAVQSNDPERLVGIIKLIYGRKKARAEQGKKTTAVDGRYYDTAERLLYSELELAMHKNKDEILAMIRDCCNAE